MSHRSFHILSGICGIVGVMALMISFSINPAPPAGASIAQIVVWGKQHEALVLAGAWLQGVGSLLEVIFILALVYIAGATKLLRGWVALFTATVIVGVSLIEISFYISAIEGGVSGDLTTLSISLNLIKAIQHAYVIAPAPALLASLGLILPSVRLLPRWFGYLAFVLAAILAVLGLVGTFVPLQSVIDIILSIQEIWFLAIAITLIVIARKVAHTIAANEQAQMAISR